MVTAAPGSSSKKNSLQWLFPHNIPPEQLRRVYREEVVRGLIEGFYWRRTDNFDFFFFTVSFREQ